MKEQIDSAISALQALQSQITEYDSLADQIENSKATLTSLRGAHDVIEGKLASGRKLLDEKQHAALQAYEKSIYDKTTTIRELMAQIETARTTLDGLRAAIDGARIEYNNIQASMEALRKRLG